MNDKRIDQLRAMKARGTLRDKHIDEMLHALSFQNALLAAASKMQMPPPPKQSQESR